MSQTQTSPKWTSTATALLLVVLGLAGLLAYVVMRTSADSVLVNQQTDSALATVTVNSQTLTQVQGQTTNDVAFFGVGTPTPPNSIQLIAGNVSIPVHLHVEFTSTNGVVNTILQPNAQVDVVAMYGNNAYPEKLYWNCQNGPDSGQVYPGSECWSGRWTDSRTSLGPVSTVVTQKAGDITGTIGELDVDMPLPFYAKPGAWTFAWRIVPVDANGDATISRQANNLPTEVCPDGPLTCVANFDNVLKSLVSKMVAIDVFAPTGPGYLNRSQTVTYTVDGANMTPGSISDRETIYVEQKGNTVDQLELTGSDWTCYSDANGQVTNGLTMPVDITHYNGGTGLFLKGVVDQLLSTGQQIVVTRAKTGDTAWTVPLTDGDQDGVVDMASYLPSTFGLNRYSSAIEVPNGVSGLCRSAITNIAVEYVAGGGGGGGAGGSCSHDECTQGGPLVDGCSACVSIVCAADSVCCAPASGGKGGGVWDDVCVSEAQSMCTGAAAPACFAAGGGGGGGAGGGSTGASLATYHAIASASAVTAVMSGNTAFLLGNDGSVQVIDASTPLSMSAASVLSTFTVGSGPHYAAVRGSHLYTSNYFDNTMSVVDISNPSSPSVLTTLALGGTPEGIAVSGNYAYVADITNSRVDVIDISTPSNPSIVANVSVGTTPLGLKEFAGYVFVANYGSNTVSVIDATTPTSPTVIATISTNAHPADVTIKSPTMQVGSRPYLLIAEQSGYVQVVDLFDINAPVMSQTVTLATGTQPNGIDMSGNYAITANLEGTVTLLDTTTPTAVTVYGTANTGGGPEHIVAFGQYAIVPNYGVGLDVVDTLQ